MALFLPVHPGRSGSASITCTPGIDFAISFVRSVDWSLTTITSKLKPLWSLNESRQAPRLASSLRAGTITETCGAITMVVEEVLYLRPLIHSVRTDAALKELNPKNDNGAEQ